MTYRFQSTNVMSVTGYGIELGEGDTLVVAPNVSVVAMDSSYSSVQANGNAIIQVYGLVSGANGITSTASIGYLDIYIAPTGAVSSITSMGDAFSTAESYSIRNYGSIQGAVWTQGGGRFTNLGTMESFHDISLSSSSFVEFYNYGTVIGDTGTGAFLGEAFSGGQGKEWIYNYGIMSGLIDTSVVSHFYNFGTINQLGSWIFLGRSSTSTFVNDGEIVGSVTFGGASGLNSGTIRGNIDLGSGTFDSSSGYIYGSISTQGGYVVGALNGSVLIGGNATNDVLVANQAQGSADLHSVTTLSAKGGINALYGGGAFNVFSAGDGNGGHNQIWGGASQMIGVSGYGNNTLSFEGAVGGVYVDILNGHNAYIASASSNWTGVGTYEDSIINVPNIVGSRFADVIQADNGIDRITGGGGADQLYAGAGSGSQDTFIFKAYSDSNIVTGYDTIVNFKRGVDKVDLSAFTVDGSHLAISTAGTSNTIYLEKVPGIFNASTDLAMIVNTSAPGGLHASDFIL